MEVNPTINKTQTFTVIKFKVQHIEQELREVIYAIHWSKTDTINPQLLSQQEKQIQ